ncbi:MAG: bifunctional adenosylcobinamide kinase/adenosylcobinamide-phosphate guanylyltransferase [Bacteroidales bacterium]|nr:bifunctional adenosylcobinamide kinase/adenosylcobinamide-phosphate guanylyltransferase [Bacteroidales bacterium]
MILIIGGAYQGKLDYAKAQYQLSPSDILDCAQLPPDATPTLNQRCIYHYEAYLELCMKQGVEPRTTFEADQIVIIEDVSCGVVPMDAHLRAWREVCGKIASALARQADSVVRIFCGLPLALKTASKDSTI